MSQQKLSPADRRRFLLAPPGDTRPSLLVELCPKVDDSILDDVRQAMYELNCANGLVLDQERCVILHDSYSGEGPQAIVKEKDELDTQRLLGANGDTLEARLERWLDALVTNWPTALPRETWAAPLLTDIVPAASGSLVYRATVGDPR